MCVEYNATGSKVDGGRFAYSIPNPQSPEFNEQELESDARPSSHCNVLSMENKDLAPPPPPGNLILDGCLTYALVISPRPAI
jgi:hypothetical protein